MEKGKIELTQKDAENTPAGGVVVGKRDGQTMIYDDASLGGYFVGKLHKDGGIKMINKSTGQPLEVQGSEVIITAPAVNDQAKHNFNGKMMTNREILSKINSDGGGVSFADGGDIPAKIHTADKEYEYGGKMVLDSDIANHLGMKSTLKKGKQHFTSGDSTYDVDAIYNAIKKGKLRLKTKEVETFPMKYPVYDKKYSETVKTDFRKPNGLTVRTESGEEVLIDGNHRMNNAYLKGRKTMKTYYIEDPKQIAKFTKKNKFELGGENKDGGHLSKNKSLKQIAEMHNVSLAHINEELEKGLEVEKEHFSDFKERTRVAKDHLVENPNYYTILEKAGLKDGGMVGKEDLVEDSKKGDTPARDLNNYNDIMDLQADGIVGVESGLVFDNGGEVANEPKEGDLITNFGKYGKSIFDVDDNYVYWLDQYASKHYCKKSDLSLNNLDDDGDDDGYYENERNSWICDNIYADGGLTPYDANSDGDSISVLNNGGGVGLPKVAYVKVVNTGKSLVGLMGLKYNNYKEFKESVEEAYKPFVNIKPIRRSFVELEAYDENNNKLTAVSTYIADQKNTVKNFNPTTGNYKNLEKSLANSRPRSFQKFDWEDWFLSKSNLSTTTAQMTNSGKFPEYYEFTQEVMSGFTKGKIYKINNPKKLGASSNFIDDEGFANGYGTSNDKYFKPSTEQAFLAQQGINSGSSSLPLDLSDTKVWIGDDERLSKAIQEVAFELGWTWSSGKTVQNTDAKYLVFNSMKFIGYRKDGREAFDANISKEINPQDILLAKKATITTSSASSSSNKSFDFTDTKIDVKGNLDLSVKVQKRAFELGWEWESGVGKAIDYSFINYLYFTKKSISDGFTTSSFVNSPKRQITEAEIFGSQTPNSNSSTTSAQNYSKEDVQSVLVTYAGGQKYNALNEERLLDKIVELWKSGGRSTMSIILQPQGFVATLSAPANVLLDTIKTSKTSIQPSTLSNSELREYLSKDWYPELDWDDFFKEVKTTTKLDSYDANRITLIWKDNSGVERIDSIDIFNGSSGGLFIEKLKDIEAQREAKDVNVIIRVFANDNNGNQFEKNDNFTIGENRFKPSTVSDEQIKSIVESWIDGINFDKFFEDVITLSGAQMPTSNSVVPKTFSDKKFTDLKEAVSALEGFASQASKKYNTADYEDGLELLKELKDDYSLALSLTPESSFMYERIEMMKKINEVQKEITKTTELRNGGAYYILSKVIDKLEKGENWKESGRGEIITNEVPEQELEAVIYTDKFKNWFGDWEKALITKEYDYVSKAITESGKPCVMYHGAKRIKYSYRQVSNGVVYLAENKSYAEWFSATDSPYQKQGDYLTQCFVNLKNPIDLTGFGVEEFDLRDIIQYIDALYPLAKIYDVLPPNVSMAIMNNQLIGRNFRAWYIIRQFPELNKHIRDNTGYDGFIYYENNPSDIIINKITGEMEENVTKATAVFNSNQVKLVDAMLFNSSLDDWRFEQGGKVN